MKSFIKDPQSTCCDERNDNSDPKDCLEKWREELEQVCIDYKIEAAETSKCKEDYDNSLGWEIKLKNWCELIETTDEKVKAALQELEFLLKQIHTVCVKSKCTYEVLQKLTCLVKTIFDCFYTYEKNEVGLKEKVEEFKKLIECLKNLGDKDKADVIACIEAYEAKLAAVCELQQAVLEKLLETLKCADLLWAYICGTLGLEDKLKGIRDLLKGDAPVEDPDYCPPEEPEGGPKYPCDDKEEKPMPEFPIKDDTVDPNTISGNAYYEKIKKEFKEAVEQTKARKEAWIDKKDISDRTLSEKNSLTEAIKASEAIDTGK